MFSASPSWEPLHTGQEFFNFFPKQYDTRVYSKIYLGMQISKEKR